MSVYVGAEGGGGLARHERMKEGGRATSADRARTETSVATAAAFVDSTRVRKERRFTKHSTGSNRTGSELVEQGQGAAADSRLFYVHAAQGKAGDTIFTVFKLSFLLLSSS